MGIYIKAHLVKPSITDRQYLLPLELLTLGPHRSIDTMSYVSRVSKFPYWYLDLETYAGFFNPLALQICGYKQFHKLPHIVKIKPILYFGISFLNP